MSEVTPADRTARAFIISAQSYLLEEYLPKIERCLEHLSAEQIWQRANSESNSVGNLILHLCGNARQWIVSGLGQQPDRRRRDEEFAEGKSISKHELIELLRATVTEVLEVLKDLDDSKLLEPRCIQGCDVDVLEAIFHVTEHFSMHTGQIILMTKILARTDLRFYDFNSGAPRFRW